MKPHTAENEDKNTDSNGGGLDVQIKIAKWTRILGWGTVALAIGTGILAGYAIRQVQISNDNLIEQRRYDNAQLTLSRTVARSQDSTTHLQDSLFRVQDSASLAQVGISRETMQRQLRAWVFVKPDSILRPDIFITLDVVNVGQTPAKKVFVIAPFIFAASPNDSLRKKISKVALPGKNYAALFPGSMLQSTIYFSDIHMKNPDSLRARINSGRAVFYVGGTVNYEDIFGKKHFTSFVFRNTPGKPSELQEYQDGNDFN